MEDYWKCRSEVLQLEGMLEVEKEREKAGFSGDDRSLFVIYEEHRKKIRELQDKLAIASRKEQLAHQKLEKELERDKEEHSNEVNEALHRENGRCADNPALDAVLKRQLIEEHRYKQCEAILEREANAQKKAILNHGKSELEREQENDNDRER